MPFLYQLILSPETDEYTFIQQLVPTGSLVGTNQPVATLTNGQMEFHLHAPMQGLLVEWFSHAGTQVQGGDTLARIVCEGTQTEVPAVTPQRLG